MSRLGGLLALAALVALGLCGSQRAHAQTATGVPDDELAALFAAFCLDAFPIAANIDRLAAGKKAVAMKADELKAALHDDPGRGWMMRSSEALYAITVESPPYNACAVRRMTPVGVSGVKNYLAAVNKYVAAKNGKLANLPPQKSTANGVDVSLYGQGMVDASGKPQETFAVVLSNYHGRAPGMWRADAGTGVGVEVRFVHQIVKQ